MKELLTRKIEEAADRISGYVLRTPLSESLELSTRFGPKVCLKWENAQPTGSFKIRGASNKILANLESCRQKGVVAASTGNHGLATAHICRQENLRLEIYVPRTISALKKAYLGKYGVKLNLVDGPCEEAEKLAREGAQSGSLVFVSPYNDEEVIAGQGTCGLEIWQDWSEVEEVVVPVGGGGLIAGIACYLKEKNPSVIITGIEPENSAFIQHSRLQGRLDNNFPEKTTIADAVAGGLEDNSITFELIQKYVDRLLTVTEEAIIQAIIIYFRLFRQRVEGAGALSLAGISSYPELFSGRKLVAIVSGGNIEKSLWQKLVFSP